MEKTVNSTQIVDKRGLAKFTSLVYLDMFIGLAVTAIACLGCSFWFSSLYVNNPDTYGPVLIGVMVGGFIALLVSEIVLSITLFKAKKAAWIPYLIYAAVMGVMLAPVCMWISVGTIAEAFGITAGVFLIMFLIGYFSKVSLTPLAFIGLGLLWGVLMCSLLFGIIYLVNPYTGILMDFIVSLVCVIAVMLITAWDANRMSREVQSGAIVTSNTALYYAYVFYTDFIAIFIHILYLLVVLKGDK